MLAETYMAEHNRAFAIAAQEEGTAFVPDRWKRGARSCALWRSGWLATTTRWRGTGGAAAAAEPSAPSLCEGEGAPARLSDGTVGVFLGPHPLARYTAGAWRSSNSRPPPAWPRARSRQGQARRRAKCAALTAPAREAFGAARSGRRNGLQVEPETAPRQGLCGPPRDPHDRGAPPACPPIIRARKWTHHELHKVASSAVRRQPAAASGCPGGGEI